MIMMLAPKKKAVPVTKPKAEKAEAGEPKPAAKQLQQSRAASADQQVIAEASKRPRSGPPGVKLEEEEQPCPR